MSSAALDVDDMSIDSFSPDSSFERLATVQHMLIDSFSPDSSFDSVVAVEHMLIDSISPDSSFDSVYTTESSDANDREEVELILAPPNVDHKFDIGSAVLECNDDQFNELNIEQHTVLVDPLAKPQADRGNVPSGSVLLPFPVLDPRKVVNTTIFRQPLDFYDMVSPYLMNSSVQLLADEPEVPMIPLKRLGSADRKPPRPRNRRLLKEKVLAGLKHVPSIVQTSVEFQELPTTKGDWKGLDFSHRLDTNGLREAWLDGSILERITKYDFLEVHYEGTPTCLVDKNLIMYAFRTERLLWLSGSMPEGSEQKTCQLRLNWECAEYQDRCGDNTKAAIKANHRGNHFASNAGVDRQSKTEPTWTKFHRDNKHALDWLLENGIMTKRLINQAASILRMRFPFIARRVDRCTASLIDMGIEEAIATPMFGLWYNYCINGARPHDGVEGVSCQPHTDGQNLAVMMCVLFVYGDFDWNEMAWLVIWEAHLIIQLPIGVLFFYPSALFIHFNINICDLHNYIVTTKKGERPTKKNCEAIKGVKGRGSIVFFNQASVFQYAELKSTVREAKAQGFSSAADNEPYISSMPRMNPSTI